MENSRKELLECIFCQKSYPLNIFFPFCPVCHEPLLYQYHKEEKRRIFYIKEKSSLKRYKDFLPISEINDTLTLGEGNTPLIPLASLSQIIKNGKIYGKNEALNPTGSFKDRGTTVAIQKAISLGLKRIGTVSTGNMASSTAAFGAKSGLSTFILVKGDTPQGKLSSASVHNPILFRVRGDYGELYKKSYSIGEENNICFMNSVDPFRIEGYKVTGFEIFEQLDRRVPTYIFVPMSSGGHIVGLMRSFLDLKREHIISQYPTFVGVQAQSCAPISQAFQAGASTVTRIIESKTIAQAISNPDPPGGNIVLKLIRENSGMIIDVSDKEILHAQKMLAESEGIFCQPASATSLAGCLKLSKELRFKKEDQIILLITGSGLKSLDTCEPNKLNTYDIDINELEESFRAILNKTLLKRD